jgi:hypothetical protein
MPPYPPVPVNGPDDSFALAALGFLICLAMPPFGAGLVVVHSIWRRSRPRGVRNP